MGRHSGRNGGGHPSHGCCVSGSILCTNHSVIKKLFWFTFLPDSFILLSSTKNEKTLRNFCCQGHFYKLYSTEKFFFLFLRRQKSPFLYFLSWWTWLVFILTLVINIPKSQCEANVCLQLKKIVLGMDGWKWQSLIFAKSPCLFMTGNKRKLFSSWFVNVTLSKNSFLDSWKIILQMFQN